MQLTVSILAAMRSELEPFLALGMGGEANEILLGKPVYTRQAVSSDEEGRSVEVTLVLMVSGVGKVRAASATQALIDRHRPDLLLNIGTAGGLRPEVKIGDIVVTTRQYQHDSQLWERYTAECDRELSDLVYSRLAASYRVHRGNGCAGDRFVSALDAKQQLAAQFDAYCVDMESAAIADTCAANQIPCCIIRSISDSLQGNEVEFEENYQRVSQEVAQAVAPLVGQLSLRLAARSNAGHRPMPAASRFTQIRTPRLLLRRLQHGDAEALWRYRSDPAVAKYQGWENYSEDQAITMVREQSGFEPGFAGTWFQLAVVQHETNELIGDIGIHTLPPDGRQSELGFTLARDHQRKGYASEAVTAVLNYLFTKLEQHRVVASVDPENEASIALLRRLGFRQEGRHCQSVWLKGAWQDDLQFALLRAEWEQFGDKSSGVETE